MKLALLADVHGILPALEAVLADADAFAPDALAVAGDLVGGPSADACIARLRERGAVMIAGNSDLGLLRLLRGEAPPEQTTRKQFGLLRWNAARLSPENAAFLAALPEQRALALPGADPIRMVHGSPRSPNEGLDPQDDPAALDAALASIDEPVLVCGHSHRPFAARRNGKLAVNPGSVAGPLNGEVGAQYARLWFAPEGWQVELRTIPYDLAPVRCAFAESGLLEAGGWVAQGFLRSIETGRDVTADFLAFAYRLAREAGCGENPALPDDIYDRAGAEFDWAAYAPAH